MRNSGFASGSATSVVLCASLSSDELTFFGIGASSADQYRQFSESNLAPNNFIVSGLWSSLYTTVYKANAIIEGVNVATVLREEVRKQLLGEARFIRALCYFYLTNLWGDVPLVLTTDYSLNNTLPRESQTEIYQQMIGDLTQAKNLLPDTYAHSNNERVRPNKGAASALLARVYLFKQEWVNAETEASFIIDNTYLYGLETDLPLVFRAISREAIFQLWAQQFPTERSTFFIAGTGPRYGALRPDFVQDFEVDDKRWISWGQTRVVQGITYYGSQKYFDFSTPPLDYSTVLRVAEQYLIRAEARAYQDNLIGAVADINMIRRRAGLSDISSDDKAAILDFVFKERRAEFFLEWGHRWLDLKRTGKVNEVMGELRSTWNKEDELYPIPENQIINNPNVTQNNNPGN
ncbi:MAG TPA: RagB/SusD family nutrient uptake outer membrane protein [Cyclobacteriaceae bacterium]|nr:RagB/SusD family nutrient uptake outer membrane protein [Cyclobacteriaceae bacterium]